MADNRDPQDRGSSRSIVSEFLEFLGQNKRWWLLPLAILVLGLGVILLLRGTN